MDKELFNLGFSYELGCGLGLLSQFLPLSKNSKLNLRFKEELTSEYSNGFNLSAEMYNQYFQNTDYSLTDVNDLVNKSTFIGFNQGQSIGWEYLDNISARITKEFAKLRDANDILDENMFAVNGIRRGTDLVYFQCNFGNPYGNRHQSQKDNYIRDILNIGLGLSVSDSDLSKYSRKGEFLNADNLAVFHVKGSNRSSVNKGLHIFVIDNSFSISNVACVNSMDDVFESLKMQHYKNMKKSNFSFISTDYHSTYDVEISSDIIQYADTLNDSSLMKMIQAGSYAYSIINFLKQHNKFIGENIHITIMGLKDNDFSVMKVPTFELKGELSIEDLMKFYDRCSCIKDEYEDKDSISRLEDLNRAYKSWDRIPAGQIADEVKRSNAVLLKDRMVQVLKSDTDISNEAIDKLGNLTHELKYVSLNESLTDFVSTENKLREKHGKEIMNSLENSKNPILILNGSPGIGKTTSLVKSASGKDTFLLMYFSPRSALGDDLEGKFKVPLNGNKNNKVLPDDIICLTASSKDPVSEDVNKNVVRYNAINKPSESEKLDYIHRFEKCSFNNKGAQRFKQYNSRQLGVEQNTKSGAYSRVFSAVDELLGKREYNKVVTTLTLQGCKKIKNKDLDREISKVYKTTSEHLKKVFSFIVQNRTSGELMVDSSKYKSFASKTQNVYIMIDEVTGSEEGKALYSDIKELVIAPLEKYYAKDNEALIQFKLILADASLVNSDVIKSHLESKDAVQTPKIYVTDAKTDKLGIYTETLDLDLGYNLSTKADVVNANCYPAAKLNVNYNVLTVSNKLDEFVKDKDFYDKVTAYEDRTIVCKCVEDILNGVQSIIYIQHIRRLDNIVSALKSEASKRGVSMEDGKDYIVISSNLDDEERQRVIAYNNEQNDIDDDKRDLKVILMTSSASRGISFKNVERLHCVVQDHNLESALMEIIQYIYRPRGNDIKDKTFTKNIEFYLRNISYYSKESEKQTSQSKSLVSTISMILLLRGCILSRIYGYVNVNNNPVSLVPLGGTGVNGVSISPADSIKQAIKEIKADLVTKKDEKLEKVRDFLEKTFSSSVIETDGIVFEKGVDGKNIYKKFVETMQQDLFKVLFFREFKRFFYYNGMMIFPMTGSVVDNIHMLKNEIHNHIDEGYAIMDIINDSKIKDAIRKPLSLVAELIGFDVGVNPTYSSFLTEFNDVENRFMAIPIQSFIYYNSIDNFKYEEDESESFGKLIEYIVRPQTKPYSVLPIVPKEYKRFPFITFKSTDFIQNRKNVFNKEYIINSTELNMMNLLFLGKRN